MIELLAHAATVAILSTLISESKLFAPVRKRLDFSLLYCPICLSFWIAAIYLTNGVEHYFLVLAIANVWMLVVMKLYEAIDEATE